MINILIDYASGYELVSNKVLHIRESAVSLKFNFAKYYKFDRWYHYIYIYIQSLKLIKLSLTEESDSEGASKTSSECLRLGKNNIKTIQQ